MTALAAWAGLAAPGSLPWLVLHDVRVKARGRQSRWGRIIAMVLLAALPVVGGALMAWRVRAGADLPLAALGYVSAVLLGMMLVMISSAYAHVLRLGRDRGELELLLTAPLPVARVVAARVAGVQAVVALPFLLLTAPFFLVSAVLGHVGWLAGPLVVICAALVATALALSIATLLDRLLGPALAKLAAQVAGVGLAGGVFALGQAPNFAPKWFNAQLAFFSQRPPAPFDLPAQAVFGRPLALIVVLGLAIAAVQFSVWLAAERLEAAPADPTAAPSAPRRSGRGRSRAVRFGGSAFAVLFGKELKLLGRDPELISQIGQQLVFMVPILALIFTDGEVTPVRLAAAGVFLSGALSSSLAWLVLCAEDAPDLIAAAPLRPGVAIRAKLTAALTPPLVMVAVLALIVLPKSPAAVAVMLPMALVAGLASAAMQAWTQPPARRSAFRKRYRSSLLMAVGEFVLLGSLAAATRLLLMGSWWTLAALAVPALLLAGVWWFRLKPAE